MMTTDGTTTSIHYYDNRPGYTSNIASSRTNTTHEMVTTGDTTLGTKDATGHHHKLQLTQPTTPCKTTKNRTPTTQDTTDNRRRRSISLSSGSSRTDGGEYIEDDECATGEQYYTFIIHKSNQNPNWQYTARGKPSPTFIAFDHGTHYHVLCATDDRGGNGARQRGRITNYLGATLAGSTEINATQTKVRYLRRFILYCIRNGIKTANRINQEMKEAYTSFQEHTRSERS
jgi:hypothetical protein